MTRILRGIIGAACACATIGSPATADAGAIEYWSFSSSAAIGPPADEFAADLAVTTATTLGAEGEVRLVRLPGLPPIPAQFGGDIVSAVAAGRIGGGFDAAYISGSSLNRAWGFLANSGVPFGPTFDEFAGFLFGDSIDGRMTGVELVQELLDLRGRGVVALPIVGSPEQLSGYFAEPLESVGGRRGIGLAGLCQKPWTLRYLPPGENILGLACDDLVAIGAIPRKAITFVAAIPGGGSLVEAVLTGTLHGFEFATPLDDLSQLFSSAQNPGTAGVRFVHTPGWQQQFLVTWLILNRAAWNSLSNGQRLMLSLAARSHVLSSYAENLRRQGAALRAILGANKSDGNPSNDMILTRWPARDQTRLQDATIRFLNARVDDPALRPDDRADYARMLEAIRVHVRENALYWSRREVNTSLRFEDWSSRSGQCWTDRCDPQRCEPGRRP
jgi:TRAP-type mannitol/chloroaromatic compound transport system substrate-binding protein